MLVYYSTHFVPIEDEQGDLVDGAVVCSDYCHRDYCQRNGLEYGGWFGCQEMEHDDEYGPLVCENCGEEI